jgi:hypothetical protein
MRAVISEDGQMSLKFNEKVRAHSYVNRRVHLQSMRNSMYKNLGFALLGASLLTLSACDKKKDEAPQETVAPVAQADASVAVTPEAPAHEAPKVEEPKVEPVAEEPKVEEPKVEHVAEEPKVEAPAETPAAS